LSSDKDLEPVDREDGGHDPGTGLEIAIIGMSLHFPGAPGVEEFWDNLREGVESISFFSAEELLAAGVPPEMVEHPDYVPARATLDRIDLFDAAFFGFSPNEARIMDPQHRFFLEHAWSALESAGYVPETFPGSIGVFAGLGENWYHRRFRHLAREVLGDMMFHQAQIGSQKDFMPTRVSYKLGLDGPSINVQTACSTSLVATHLACQSLQSGESDMALAGGVAITVPQTLGYLYEEGGTDSRDGHCRAFDARADGTVDGSGVGVVLLKRLDEALEDGDHVWAVIRGSAVNNDGNRKPGYTAPSVEGQARCVQTALDLAEVDAETIGYVEAHGSATALGDPVEVAALSRAFGERTSKKGYCGLGSVKSNFGHLDAAAGIAGLIKTTLALDRGLIPPSLHFETPNPEIDFENSPFRVAGQLTEFARNGVPRRAGVSSVGLGGTNAHVVLEEAPPREPSQTSRAWRLLVLSARTPAALDDASRRLADHLEAHPELALADVAHTLAVGRRSFGQRRMLLCRDTAEAVRQLRAADPRQLVSGQAPAAPRPVAFLLPGVGDQYAEMAAELYRMEKTFRETVDFCCARLASEHGIDLGALLFRGEDKEVQSTAPGERGGDPLEPLRRSRSSEAAPGEPSELDATHHSQPAIFVLGYALARQLESWGLRPEALIGYSLGEYTAACLAGVLSLEDALDLVARRAQLIAGLDPGAMLAVPLSAEELGARLPSDLSLAASNAPHLSVVAGGEEAVARFADELAAEGLAARPLRTRHAFHSREMDEILDAFREVLAEVELEAPRIPWLSNVSGDWITAEEAVDPEYWVRHLRQTVRFSEGIGRLLERPELALVELGPGQTLSTFARQHPDAADERPVLSALPGADDPATSVPHLLRTLGRLWLAGVGVDWPATESGERLHRVPLPTYPFERKSYWIELPAEAAGAGVSPRAASICSVAPPGAAPLETRREAPPAQPDSGEGLERTVARLWEEVLGHESVGPYDNFFELGGHSLLATQLVTRLREACGVELPLRALSEAPTPKDLSELISELRAAGQAAVHEALPEIEPDLENLHLPFPLTDVQEAYWIGRSAAFELGNISTHVYLEYETSNFDLERYQNAWRRMIERHGMLRGIVLESGEQKILPLESLPTYEIPVLDLSGQSEEDVEAAIAEVRARMSHQMLPSDRWPLFDIQALRIDAQRMRLNISFDILIADAWSFFIIRRELHQLYHHPETELEPLEISFRDYILAERAFRKSAAYDRARSYWRDRLDTLPPAPELPLAQNPGRLEKPHFERRAAELDAEAWGRLKALATRHGLTATGFLIAAFGEVLATWSKQPRFTLNLTIFNRLPLHRQVFDVIGDFTSLSLLEVDSTPDAPFLERARRITHRLWDDLDHRYYSGVSVMRDLARKQGTGLRAIMPVIFTSTLNLETDGDDTPPPPRRDEEEAGSLGAAASEEVYSISQTPQVWLDHQISEEKGRLTFNWDTVDSLFPEGMMDEMFAAYCQFLERLAADEALWQEVHFDLLPAAQKARRIEADDTAAEFPRELLQTPFERRAAAEPEAVAVVAGERELSYGELAERSRSLAAELRRRGARRGELIAICMEKGWEQVVAAVAVVSSGAAYLPVDPNLPRERRGALLSSGRVRWVLTQGPVDERLEWPDGVELVRVDESFTETSAETATATEAAPAASPDDLAYVIFTSGSTGQPKGVMIEHAAALNTIVDVNRRFGVEAQDRVLALSSLSFDLSVWDVFGTLAAGATIVMPGPELGRDPEALAAFAQNQGVTVWNSVPAWLELLVEYAESRPETWPTTLRLGLLSGDWIPTTLPGRVRALSPEMALHSLGGATEGSIWSITWPIGAVDPGWASIPYGRALANQTVRVLDEALEPRPDWVPGEIFIGGRGVARGYWDEAEKTARQFFPHPRTGERLYRTGDLGRYLPSGDVEFLGREDHQVKVQGYRVELGEIEAALLERPDLLAVAVVAQGDPKGSRRLVAHAVPAPGARPGAQELHDFLEQKLPAYMVPTFVFHERLPVTSNGKVDRAALLDAGPADDGRAGEAREGAAGELGRRLAALVAEVVEVERVDPHADLLEIGITSIEMVKLANRLEDEFTFRPTLENMFQLGSVDAFTDFYAERLGDDTRPELPGEGSPRRAGGREYEILRDPEEIERFKKSQPGLRSTAEGSAAVELPPVAVDDALRRLYARRGSHRRFTDETVPLERLATLLSCLYAAPWNGHRKWRYGSAGGLYPVQVYPVVHPGRVAGLEAGVYYYHPTEHRLHALAPGAKIERDVHEWINQPIFDTAAFSLFLFGQLDAIGPIYGPEAVDYCFLEAGLLTQTLEMAAAEEGLGFCQIGSGGVYFEKIRDLFQLGEGHLYLHTLLGGPVDFEAGEPEPASDNEWDEGEL